MILVRRIGVLRFLFGMRPRKKALSVVKPAPMAVEPVSAHAETEEAEA